MSSTQLNAEQSDAVRKHMRYDVDNTTYYLEVLFEMYGFYVSAYYVCTHMFVLLVPYMFCYDFQSPLINCIAAHSPCKH